MRPRTVPVRLGALLPEAAGPSADVMVTGITLDSRSVAPGDLYAALPGRATHGARFAGDAVRAGAAAVITDAAGAAALDGLVNDEGAVVPVVPVADPRRRLGPLAAAVYGHPGERLQVIGVTGTNGKTTVAAMVDAGLRAAGRTTGVIGTVGTRIAGVAYPGVRTTPEATDLHALLAVMLEAGVDSVVMEVSSIAVREGRVDGLAFDVAAFTNLTQDHLDYHGTMEEYYAAKAALFSGERTRTGIVGIDDEWGQRLAAQATASIQSWSLLDPRADWHAERIEGLEVVGPGGERTPVSVTIPGSYNVANAVCAFAILLNVGVTATDAAAGIAAVSVPGRMQVVQRLPVLGVVDYAHTPDAVERVLRAAREEVPGRIVTVLGAGGDRDRGKRPLMGEIAARLSDIVVVADDNPRSEEPDAIRAAIVEGAHRVSPDTRAHLHNIGDRRAAIRFAAGLSDAGDAVVVLGKGHEQGQEVRGVVTPFDDAAELQAALADAAVQR
jgi:UDP-N-acetylmuramoyl-L-alanyl-D-glutamate--2,6-diaminopimelate ligase